MDSDAENMQDDAWNERLAHAGHEAVSSDEMKLISAMLKESLLSELEALKGRDLTFEPDAHEAPGMSGDEHGECVICGSTVKEFGHYTMEFGSHIRKKANLCGLDCVSEFVGSLREAKGL